MYAFPPLGHKKTDSFSYLSLLGPFPPRPRLSNQIRSFFTSFTSDSDSNASPAIVVPKARSSHQIGGSSSAHMFQGLSASAQALQNDVGGGQGKQSTLKPLAMPSARQAGPEGLYGLNDDSPPLTPAASEERDSDSYQYEMMNFAGRSNNQNELNDNSSIWTPFSSSSSGRTSPANGVAPGRSSSMRVVTGAPYMKTAKVTHGSGILPSHMISPPSSPDSHYTPNGRKHRNNSITAETELQPKLFDLNVLQGLSSLSSLAISRMHNFFFSAQMPPLRPHVPALFFLLTAFVGSTICILLALSTLPLKLPNHITDLTLNEIREMSLSLREYSRSSNKAFAHTLIVLGTFFTWKQAFTVPGSIIMNVVFGAMYGTLMGTLYTSVLTAFGGMLCYILMAPIGPFISAMPGLNKGLQKMRKALQGSMPMDDNTRSPIASTSTLDNDGKLTSTRPRQNARSFWLSSRPERKSSTMIKANKQGKGIKSKNNGSLWSYLLVLRLLPVVPYGLMNIACSVLRVPLLPYTITLGLGSIPWNACTVQVGDLLAEVASVLPVITASVADQIDSDGFTVVGSTTQPTSPIAQSGMRAISEKIWNKEMMFKLILMSLVSLAPMLIQKWIKKNEEECEEETEEEGSLLREIEQVHA
jgi:uncharacterized membrane protein YdjX (TVP38/TMEM64 family)